MEDHECHRVDAQVEGLFAGLRGKAAVAGLAVLALHLLLFAAVKRRVLKTHDH